MLNKMKDSALSKAFKLALNSKIKRYGKMLKLNLDSKQKCIDMEVMLDGEQEPLEIHIGEYSLTQEGDRYILSVNCVTTSRAWIDTVASSYLEGKSFEIPQEYAKMLKTIV